MEHLTESNHIRRNPAEALRLAEQLEPNTQLHLEGQEVMSTFFPLIDYRRDALLEIHNRLRLRKEISDPKYLEKMN